MRKAKYILLVAIIATSAVRAGTLISDNFIIEIERQCPEGHVTCEKIQFTFSPTGIDKKQVVIGTTIHTKCADGLTPCAFQGYEFHSNGDIYFINESGFLVVRDKDGNTLLAEQGEWQ